MPGIRFVHAETGVLGIEWIEGTSVRNILGGGAEGEEEEEESGEDIADEQDQEVDQDEPEIDQLKETYGLTEGEPFARFTLSSGKGGDGFDLGDRTADGAHWD